MEIYIDADGCPVTKLAIKIANLYNINVNIICDSSHFFSIDNVNIIMVDKGPDSADFKLANLICKDDIAITQDYGLAAMCLAKNARVLNQDGLEYTSSNIDSMLLTRHIAKKILKSGKRLKGPKKRTCEQDNSFKEALIRIIEENTQKQV